MRVQKRKTVGTVLAIAAALLLSAVCVALCRTSWAKAELSGVSFDDEYLVGTELSVPAGVLSVGGKSLAAEHIVNFPGGTANRSDKVTLTEMGVYTVEYRAQDGGREYREFRSFSAYRNLYEVEGGFGASIGYQPSEHVPDVAGVNVKLASGSTLYYNKVIDLNDLGGNTPFLSLFISPEVRGEMDGYTLYCRLTDIYNPDNYITYRCNASRAGIDHGVTYILCGAAHQALSGLEAAWNRLHVNNIYGAATDCSFYGRSPSGRPMERDLLKLYFDTQSMLATCGDYGSYIIDLDDPTYFADPFMGFTTGEVTMTMWADDFLKPTMGLEILSIAGHDLSENRLTDTQPPIITIDTDGYDEWPIGLAGHDYPLFGASARDQYCSDISVTARVYENYYDQNKYECLVVDGVFKPEYPGRYTVEYTAADYSGNVSVMRQDILIQSTAPAVVLTVNDDRTTAGFVGERIAVAAAQASGGVGRAGVTVRVFDENGRETPVNKGCFVAPAAGEYTVEYTAADFVRQTETIAYDVAVSVSDKPVFDGDPELPEVLFTGTTYELPGLTAVCYAGGRTEIPAVVTVRDARGERTLGSNRRTIFNVDGPSDTVEIIYTASAAGGSTSVTYARRCIRTTDEENSLQLSAYFETDGFEQAQPTNTYTRFVTSDGVAGASLRFLNPLLADGLTAAFSIDTENSRLGAVRIRLTDVQGERSVSGLIRRAGKAASLSVCGKTMALTNSFNDALNNSFNIVFNNENCKLSADGTNYLPVTTTDQGQPFDGFASHMAMLTIELLEVTGRSAIHVTSINAQPITNVAIDRVQPRIFIEGLYGGTRKIGETVTINRAYTADVLDPNPTLTVRVVGPDGETAKATDGTPLEDVNPNDGYRFTLESYGTYRVTYTSTDTSGRTRSVPYNITVLDDVAPQIAPQAGMVSRCAKGDTVVVPKVTVSDNVTAEANIRVRLFVLLPTGRLVELTGNAFVASYTGVYAVRYVAYDEAGNQAVYEMNVQCE